MSAFVPGITKTTAADGSALRFHRGVGFCLYYTNAYGGRVAYDHATSEAGCRRRLKSVAPAFRDLMVPWFVAPCVGDGWHVTVTYRSGSVKSVDAYADHPDGGCTPGDVPADAFTRVHP